MFCQFNYGKKQAGFNAGDNCPNVAIHMGFCAKHRRMAGARGMVQFFSK